MTFLYHKKYYGNSETNNENQASKDTNRWYLPYLWFYESIVLPSLLMQINFKLGYTFILFFLIIVIEKFTYTDDTLSDNNEFLPSSAKSLSVRVFEFYDLIMLGCMLLTIMALPIVILFF